MLTVQEMLEMRVDGATYQEIADVCGCSRQFAEQRISAYIKRMKVGARGKEFSYLEIKFKGIRGHFEVNTKETTTSFAEKVGVQPNTMRNFLKGNSNSFFSIPQIKRMCEIVGKPFEEVFEEVFKEG